MELSTRRVVKCLNYQPAESVEAAVADALTECGSEATIAVIPKGPYVMAELGS